MFDKILNMLQDSEPSYKDRLKTMDAFFQKYDLYKEMWPAEAAAAPLSIVWAVSSKYPEIFLQQLGAMLQFDGLLQPDDEIIFVGDRERKDDLIAARVLTQNWNTKGVIINRPFIGDGPALNWDVGVEYTKHEHIFFLRDLGLFFNPWETISAARAARIEGNLVNLGAILGPVWSRFSDRWLYLIHPRFAPNPFLFAFVASKTDYLKMNGFDTMLSRGYDHTGELDFLLRWNMAGLGYEMTEEHHIFHPGISANSQQELEEMQFQSIINRRYFFDRYGEEFISALRPPYKADMAMIEVNHALTFAPLSEVIVDDIPQFEPIKDAFDFNKWPSSMVIAEEV